MKTTLPRNLALFFFSTLFSLNLTGIAPAALAAEDQHEEHAHDNNEHSHEEDHEEHDDHSFAENHEEHDDHSHAESHEEHEDHVLITASMADEVGLETDIVAAGSIAETIQLYGKVVPDPQHVSHVAARYPGLIKVITPTLGDTVEAGQHLATIEANTSLQNYQITAPLSGVVIEKHANPGEIAGEDPLMTIANYLTMWVDLTVFPGDAAKIRPGLPVTVLMDELTAESTVSYLNPTDNNSPVIIARVPLENPDLYWTPGLLVEAQVEIDIHSAELVIDNRAIQTFENQTVVFVREGDEYEARPVTLGHTDNNFTEVLSGLAAGEEYVTTNSYLIKADLEKDGVTHEH